MTKPLNPEDRFEDIDWFLKCGVHPLLILEQIGLKVGSIARYCHRHGRPDLAAVFQPFEAEQKALKVAKATGRPRKLLTFETEEVDG